MTDLENPIAGKPACLNPYYIAAAFVVRRLRWDLDPASWSSRAALRRWKDRHRGQKAVIVCNGPSLLRTDLSLLGNVFTFGLNKINLLFDKSAFRPSCIVSVNPLVIEQNAEFFNRTPLPLFIDTIGRRKVARRENVVFLHSEDFPSFARDCTISLYQGGTVTFVAMQLAFHMGFDRVALVGCDHNFVSKGPAHAVAISGATDANHFDPKYFADGARWHLPDLPLSEMAYSMARTAYDTFGRSLVNCTDGGHLEILNRMPLEEFVRS